MTGSALEQRIASAKQTDSGMPCHDCGAEPLFRRLACALLATTALASPAIAQQDTDISPQTRLAIDANGVDLAAAEMNINSPQISIGTRSRGLTFQSTLRQAGTVASWNIAYKYVLAGAAGTAMQVVLPDRTINFNFDSPSGLYLNQQGNGETLINGGTNWTFTKRDGTVIVFDGNDFDQNATTFRYGQIAVGAARTITLPNHERLSFAYKEVTSGSVSRIRLQSVQSSGGYMLKLDYADNSTTYSLDWARLVKATLFNGAVDYCNPTVDTCTFSTAWPALTFAKSGGGTSPEVDTITDALNRTTTYTIGYTGNSNGRLQSIQRPTSSTPDIVMTYDSNQRVASVARDGQTWSYAWSFASPLMTATITNPDSTHHTFVTDTGLDVVKTETDELNRSTSYSYDAQGRMTELQNPEGNKADYTYDARGNVTQKRLISKTPGTPADIVISATYVSSCGNALTCNQPTSTADANGKTTNYTYDPTHGGILTVTRPAPTTGAVQPQVRYGYTAYQAYFKNSAGSIVASGQPTYVLTSISQCQTLLSCSGTADEAKSTFGFGPQVAGTANNLLPVSLTSSSGDGVLTTTTAFTYDSVGNITYSDGPLNGTADTSRTIYDAGRQVVGQIGPDPDGSGPLVNRAIRTTYNLDGLVTKVEHGTTTGQTDSNWTSFSPADETDIGYDSGGREVSRSLSRSGTIYALSQISYYATGRTHCSAVRMNSSAFASPPANACTLGTAGSNGPDRIRQMTYDAAGEISKVETGVGTAAARTERALTYTNNGLVQTLADGNSNVTTYTYDGFDRQIKTAYPDGSTVQVAAYDANGNAITVVNRASQTFSFTYDALNRTTAKSGAVPGINYSYDNLDRMLTATFASGGQGITNTYDQLSRQTSTSSNLSGTAQTLSYQYDLAGRRTQLTYPDGHYLNYDHLVTGEVTAIRLNGATSGVGVIASYAYDSLGNRTGITFGDGSSAAYAYDPVSRLSNLTNSFAVSTNNLTKTFAYSPSSQIASSTSSNDAYAWNGAANINRSYSANALNQYAKVNSVSYSYDGNSNLASDGTNTYGYDAESHMTSAAVGGVTSTLSYDPLGRLWRVVTGSNDTRYLYDGSDMVVSYNGTTLAANWMFGPGTDEPISAVVTGNNPTGWFHTDERGSIITRTDGNGNVTAIQSYDEYGMPASSNVTGFQYTGQLYLSAVGMYYYKARMYSTTLGRFMQTDPIGYGDGPNWYAYAHNDPVNGSDPLGLDDLFCTGSRISSACGGGGLATGDSGFSSASVTGRIEGGGSAGGASYVGGPWQGLSTSILGTSPESPGAAAAVATYGGYYFDGVWNSVSMLGAFSFGQATGRRYLCASYFACPKRDLTSTEKSFYTAFGLPPSVVNSAVLIQGLPPGPYYGAGVLGYTVNNRVYLPFGIGDYLADPYWAGSLGHELYHVWQYQMGATALEFGIDQVILYGHDQSPLEIPAINFGRHICQVGGGGSGC